MSSSSAHLETTSKAVGPRLETTSKAVGQGQGQGSKGKPLREAGDKGKGHGHGQGQEGKSKGTGSQEDPESLLDSEPSVPYGLTIAQKHRARKQRVAKEKAAAGFVRPMRAPIAVKGAGKPDDKGRTVANLKVTWPVNAGALGVQRYKDIVADAAADSHYLNLRIRRQGDLPRLYIEGENVGHWFREMTDLTKEVTGKGLEDVELPEGSGGQEEGDEAEAWHGAFLRELLSLHPDSEPVFEDGYGMYEAFELEPKSEPEEDELEPKGELEREEAELEPQEELADSDLGQKEQLEEGELGLEEAKEETMGSSLKREFEEGYEELPVARPSSKKARLAQQSLKEHLNRVKPTFVIQTGGFDNMAKYYPEQEENWKEANRLQRKLRARDDDVLMELVYGRLKPMNRLVKDAITSSNITGFSLYVCMYVCMYMEGLSVVHGVEA